MPRHMCGGQRAEDSCWSPFSLGQRDGTHDVRLGGRLLYPLSSLICRNGFFVCLFCWLVYFSYCRSNRIWKEGPESTVPHFKSRDCV